MRQRARKTVATTVARAWPPRTAARRPHAAVAPAATALEMRGNLGRQTSGRATTRAAPCGGQRTTAEPGRRGERPPQSGPALTGARCAPARSVGPGGRSPLRPGWCSLESTANAHRMTSVAPMGHHASDCPAALGPVKARRSAPPARRAAGGLDGALGAARLGAYVMAQDRCPASLLEVVARIASETSPAQIGGACVEGADPAR